MRHILQLRIVSTKKLIVHFFIVSIAVLVSLNFFVGLIGVFFMKEKCRALSDWKCV